VGVTGLLIAALFAATMSSIDSGIHSSTVVLFTNVYRSDPDTVRQLALGRVAVLVLGTFVTVLAIYIGRIGSIFEIANKIVNGLGSPLLALFLIGMFSRRATSWGMLVGGLLGAALSAAVSLTVQNLALHYYAVANLIITSALCYAFSLIDHGRGNRPSPSQLAWTLANLGSSPPAKRT